ATPDLAARLERPEGTQERAPARHSRLARQQLADHDAVAAEALAGGGGAGGRPGGGGGPRAGGAAGPRGGGGGPRPAPGGRRARRSVSGFRSARRPAVPSPVTSPRATSAHSASSAAAGRRPVARAMSARNEAPRRSRCSNTARASDGRSRGTSACPGPRSQE